MDRETQKTVLGWAAVLIVACLVTLLVCLFSGCAGATKAFGQPAGRPDVALESLAANLVRVVAGAGPQANMSTGIVLATQSRPSDGQLVLTTLHGLAQAPIYLDYPVQLNYAARRTWLRFGATELVATSAAFGLALIRVRPGVLSHGVRLGRFEDAMATTVGDELVVASIPGGRLPFLTFGRLVGKFENVEGNPAWTTTAQMMPGSSGGGVFWQDHGGRWLLVGVCLCVNGQKLDAGAMPIAHEAYFVPLEFIWDFLEGSGFAPRLSR